MLFNSLEYIIFFPIVTILYYLVPHRYRWCLLLCASYYFYMCWVAEYIFLIVCSTLVVYGTARLSDRYQDKHKKKIFLYISVVFNLGLLIVFKYLSFLSETVHQIFNQFNFDYSSPVVRLLMPVGISFYTFQIIGYSIDVSQGRKKAESHLGIFALFVSFFPQLVNGPIERSKEFLPQFFQRHHLNLTLIREGLILILWGFIKKSVIADRLALQVDKVYSSPTDYQGLPLIIATILFSFQIFCDFSGYCDIALGSAKVLGFRLTNNFKRPFAAKSIGEFWQRWHITLSHWIRDYVYVPLVLNRKFQGRIGVVTAILISFFLIGLWHGPKWNYIIAGLLHGTGLIYELLTKKWRNVLFSKIPIKLRNALCLSATFSFFCFTGIFFRASSVPDALHIIKYSFVNLNQSWASFGFENSDLLVCILLILLLESAHFIYHRINLNKVLLSQPLYIRWFFYYAMLFAIICFGVFTDRSFIYFQF